MDHHHRHRDNTPEHGSNPNSRSKPQRKNFGTPGDNESYNKKTTEASGGEVFPEDNPEAYDSQGSNDARRKGELNHAIFVKLQEISQYNIEIGNYDEGLANYDRCIDHLLRTLPQGPAASMFKDFLIKTVKYLNEVALRLLQEEKVKDSLLLLERCRKMTHPNSFGPYPTLRSLTYNHLGCCYRRIGKLDKAVYYLEKAWEFIQDIERVETSGITHINLCAVLSQLGDHKRALEHATMAVSDCSFDLIEATKKNAEGDPKVHVHKQATMLAISYHNLATEEEACRNGEAALQAYLRAYNLVREYNPPQHELCVKFGRAYEEARARISRPGFNNNKRANSPSEGMRRYGNSPQNARVVVKRPASFNTANKAAKAYLQNNRVVIPKRTATATQQPRPLLSSPQNAQLTQKLFVPSASQRRIERPVTAHPQSRTQHYQVSGLNETPRSQKETHQKHDEEDEDAPNRPSHSEANSEIERLGLDDEELENADLKSNRLAFLQSLNQYNMDKSTKGGVVPQRNNFLGGIPDNKAAQHQEQAHGHQEKRARIQSAKPQGRGPAKPRVDQAKIDQATVKLQAFCRGYIARQEVAKVLAETPQQVYLVLIAETVKGNLENGPLSKETLYFFLMIYELDSQLIHIHIKNLENRKFHRALVEYQVANRTSKAAIINELREACERLIQHLEIHNDQIVFRDDVTDRGVEGKPEDLYMMGQELARREAENAITQITERTEEKTDESEVRPMGSRNQEEELGSETGNKRYGQSHSHSHSGDNIMEEKIEEENLVDDIAEEDDKYEEEAFDAEEPADKKKQKAKPKKVEEDIEDDIEEENDKEGQPLVDTNDIANLVGLQLFGGRKQEEVEQAAETIQKHMRGKMEKDKYQIFKEKDSKVVFSKAQTIDKNVIEFRLVQKPDEEDRDVMTYDLCCYNLTTGKQFHKIDYPIKKKKVEKLTLTKLLEKVDVDVPHSKVTLKKKEKKDKKDKKKKEEEEELPDLEDKDVQNATLAIQKAYKNKKNKQEKKEKEVKEEPKPQHKEVKEEPKPQPKEAEKKKKEEEEELPDLEDKDVQNATLAIQKAYKNKKNKQEKKEKEIKEEEQPKHEPVARRDTVRAFGDNTKEQVEKAAQTIQKHLRGKLARDKFEIAKDKKSRLVFSKVSRIQGNIISFKLVERGQDSDSYMVCCQNHTTSKKFDTIEIPQKSVNLKSLTVDQLIALLDIDVFAPKVTLKGKSKAKDQKSPDYEEEEWDVEPVEEEEEEEKPKPKPQPKKEEGPELLASVPLYFGKEKLDSTIHYDKKKDQILVKHGFEHGKEAKSLDIPVRDLEIGTEFSKDYFISNMDIVLLCKLNYKNGHLTYERSPMHLPVTKADVKTEKKLATPNKRYNQDFDEKDLTSQREEEDKKEDKSALQDSYRSGNFEVNQEAEELTGKKGGQIRTQSIDALGEVGHYRSGNVFAPGQVKMGKRTGEEEKKQKRQTFDDELPNLADPDVQNATLTIQKAYKNKKNKPKEEPIVEEKPKQKEKEKKNKKQEEEEELPDLEDKDVQNATLTIQKAYKNKKNKSNKPPKEEPKPQKKEEEEELPDLEDKDVQNATLTIQKAYKNKKNKNKAPKEEPKPQKKEEEEELPDLEDKDVQNATLTIQKAYKNKKNKNKAPKEEPKPQPKEEEEEELPDLEDKDVQNATLTIQKAYKNKKNKQNKATKEEEPKHHHHHHHKKEEEEELPNLEDKDVQNATLTIQKAYKNKKNKNKAPKEEPKPQKKEEEEELPDLEDKDVQNATLTIQKAYKNKKNKNKAPKEEPKPQPKEEEEELPDLEDKDVQNATLTIQKAYKNKKNKNKAPKEEPKPQPKEEEEELPDLEDKDVQNATLTIQKAYKNKKNKNKAPKEEPKPQPKEEEEELPDLEDKDVQNATLAIQKAYLKKKNKQNKAAKEEPVVEKPVVEEKPKKKEEEEEELPDLEDKDVQNATLAIQKAYLKKKNKQNKAVKEEPVVEKPVVEEQPKKKEEEEEELPDLEDKDVQNATLAIQKAYLKKKNKQKETVKAEPVVEKPVIEEKPEKKEEEEEELPDLEDKDVQNATLAIQKAYLKKKNKQKETVKEEPVVEKPIVEEKPQKKEEEEEELPDLEDKDVQNATLAIQKAYLKKKNKQKETVKAEPVVEKPVVEEKPQKKEEEEEELPDLEDKDVQNATLAIQKAYLKKKNKQKEAVKEEPVVQKPVVEEKPQKKEEEEEELPDLEDKDVQNATLAIQKAYLKKKNKQKEAVKEEPVKEEPVVEKPVVEEKPQKKEEEEELPNLEDPDVQNATLAIQKAYLKKKNKPVAQPEKKPSPKKETKKNDDSDFDYEPDFSEPKSSPTKSSPAKTKPRPEAVAHNKDKSDNFELVNVTQDQKPEDVEKLLKEVNDEFDVFNQKEKSDDDDNKPYEEEESMRKKKSPAKKKADANDDDEDFEPIEDDF